jgi:hypothetical protein
MFRTEINIIPYAKRIDHQSKIFSIGSCFAQIIGKQLLDNKFPILKNPFGIIYNASSIANLLQMTIKQQLPEEESYLSNQGIFYNYYFHGDISAISLQELQMHINRKINEAHHYLKTTKWLMITLGTAFVYQRVQSGKVVANCHKISAKEFNRRLNSTEEVVAPLAKIIEQLQSFNPNLQIIFTVSPVRHTRDGLSQNAISKATLRLACSELVDNFSHIDYFPSYEMMIDDLRDYRFYSDDLVHPSTMAEEYIWQKFQQRYMSESTQQLIKDWYKVRQAIQHKPFYPGSTQHQNFLQKTIQKLQLFKDKLSVEEELEALKKQLQ